MEYVDKVCDKYNLDKFGDISAVKKISDRLKQRPRYVVCGILVLVALSLLIPYVRVVVKAVSTFLIPAYRSFKALESDSDKDDKRWLTYWIVFGFVQFFDHFLVAALKFIPFFHMFQTLLLTYLHLNKEQGSAFLFENAIGPIMEQVRVVAERPIAWIDNTLGLQVHSKKE